jgi:hypothetical protein
VPLRVQAAAATLLWRLLLLLLLLLRQLRHCVQRAMLLLLV